MASVTSCLLRVSRANPSYLHRQDAQIAGQATGAMSWAFISALKKNPQQSYVSLLNSIREELESKYTQKPQLSCRHPLSKQSSNSSIATISEYEHDAGALEADEYG